MYLSGTYTFNTQADDQVFIFEKPAGNPTWATITQAPGSYPFTFSAGLYNVAIDWVNECAPGLSAVQIVPP